MQKKTSAGSELLGLVLILLAITILAAIIFAVVDFRKSSRDARQQSVSGIEKARANTAVKHLSVLSAYNGEVIIHSAVHGDAKIFSREIGATSKPGYLRWCDTNGAAHELYVSDRTVIHIASEPLALKGNNPGAETAPRPEADK